MLGEKRQPESRGVIGILSRLALLTFVFHILLSVWDKVRRICAIKKSAPAATISPNNVSIAKNKKRGFSLQLLLYGTVVAVGMGYRSWLLWPYFRACYLVPSWGQTEGVVRSATVARSYYGAKQRYWQVKPLYSYEVGGRHFEGTLFQVTPQLTHAEACATSLELLAKERVPIYYDKSNPAFSTLIIPTAHDVLIEVGLIGTVFFLVAGLYVFCRLIMPRHSN